MKLTITPAISPEIRQKLADVLRKELQNVAYIDGGSTMMDGTECSIYIEPCDGKIEENIRFALTGYIDEPPWPFPTIKDPEDLPTEIP